jgi:hypothetical protein
MREVREGDRIIITMKPELAYGERARTGIPPNSTLTFDYEILAVKPLSIARLLRDRRHDQELRGGAETESEQDPERSSRSRGNYKSAGRPQETRKLSP